MGHTMYCSQQLASLSCDTVPSVPATSATDISPMPTAQWTIRNTMYGRRTYSSPHMAHSWTYLLTMQELLTEITLRCY